jgi:polyisoprenoid-binding protein YceI
MNTSLRFASAAVLALALGAVATTVQAATPWTVDYAGSSLTFSASQAGATFQGRFKRFTPVIRFAANDLPGSSFDVIVDLASVDTAESQRDDTLRGSDFFAIAKFPQAHFVSQQFTRQVDGRYAVRGQLQLRDIKRDVVLTVSFTEQRQGEAVAATLEGSTTLQRLDFGVGQGEWRDTGTVGNEVRVAFKLRLKPAAAPAKP